MSLVSLAGSDLIEEGEMVIENGPEGKVRLTLRKVFMDSDGPTITGTEMLCRARAILNMTPEWYLLKLLLWEESIPDEWCFEGLTIVFPITSFKDSDGKEYVMCLEEDERHPLNKWQIVLHPIVDAKGFGQGIRFVEVESLDDTATEPDVGGEGDHS